jgi:DNA-binding NarL/FixJ family response regulator
MATRIRVLLADDSNPMRDAIGTLLKTEPAITVIGEVSTYRDLLKELDGSTVDVILMDIHMPGLRDSDSFKDVLRRFCILGMSFWANEETSRIAAEFGAVQLLDKGNPGVHADSHDQRVRVPGRSTGWNGCDLN